MNFNHLKMSKSNRNLTRKLLFIESLTLMFTQSLCVFSHLKTVTFQFQTLKFDNFIDSNEKLPVSSSTT